MSEAEEKVVEEVSEEQTTKVEKEARLMGWVPKDDFRDGDHWVDAETFVQRGKEINPILRKNNENLLKKLEERDQEVADIRKTADEFKAFQKEMTTRKVADLEKELKVLRQQKSEAITAGDGESTILIDEAIDAVKEAQQEAKVEPVVEPTPEVNQKIDPLVTKWMSENKWFATDDKMTRIADAIGVSLNQSQPNLVGADFFTELDKELADILPEEYRKKGRTNPVEGNTKGNNRPTRAAKESYENLPGDAKSACDRFVKQGFMTKEQYVADYDWS